MTASIILWWTYLSNFGNIWDVFFYGIQLVGQSVWICNDDKIHQKTSFIFYSRTFQLVAGQNTAAQIAFWLNFKTKLSNGRSEK